MSDVGDRNHPATPTRREQARREGDFAKSTELAAAIQMLGATLVGFLLLGGVAVWLRDFTRQWYQQAGISSESSLAGTVDDGVTQHLSVKLLDLVATLSPVLILLMLVSIVSHWMQTGPTFIAGKASPDLNRISPMRWGRRMFSARTLVAPFVGVPKTLIAVAVAIGSGWAYRNQFFELANWPADVMVAKLFGLVLMISFFISLSMLATALLDWAVNWYSREQRLRMTDQQLRDELRMQNGDPQMQQRRRAIQQSGLRRVERDM